MAGRTGAAGKWDGLCSRDPGRRQAALDGVRQAVLSLSERLGGGGGPPAPSPGCSSPADGLNEYLVRLLVLSRRCPFSDVRDKCGAILQVVQQFRMDWQVTIQTLKKWLDKCQNLKWENNVA